MRYSVLIVDDNAPLLNLYQIVFEREGYRVHKAENGREALERVNEEVPDVILLDVMMPDMDGIEVCRLIRAQWPDQPPCIVIYTANNRPEVRNDSMEAGANVFLSKNMPLFELPAQISRHLPPLGAN